MTRHSVFSAVTVALIACCLSSCSDNSPNGLAKQLLSTIKNVSDKKSADAAAPKIKELIAKLKEAAGPDKPWKELLDPDVAKELDIQFARMMFTNAFGSQAFWKSARF